MNAVQAQGERQPAPASDPIAAAGPRAAASDRALVAALLITVIAIWGLTYVLIRIGMQYSPPEFFAILRTGTGGALLCIVALALRRPFPRGWHTHGWLFACGVTGCSIFFTGMNYGAAYVSAGETSLFIYTQPFWITLFAWWLLGQPLNRIRIAGLIVGFSGVAAVALGKVQAEAVPAWNAYLVITLGTVGFSISAVWFVRHLRGVGLEWAVGLQNVYGALVIVPGWLLLDGGRLPTPAPGFWLAYFFTSVFSTLIGGLAYSSLLRRRDATIVSAWTFLVPVVATVAGFLILGETIALTTLLGGSAVALGIYLVNRTPSQRERLEVMMARDP
ncbi:MAG: hypothetical protein QOF51_251 [Chloroflexota bacterium]|jgi:drug/metabolite transporter (DMT)-like permease|nr:hypothetical protein [Chloroflexota bacterium]